MSQLRIDLLGSLNIWRDGQPVPAPALPSRKTCQLFKILGTHRHRAVSSDEIIEWLWPHLTPECARNSLWVAIRHLRRVLEPGRAGRNGGGLEPGAGIGAEEWRQLRSVRAGRMRLLALGIQPARPAYT